MTALILLISCSLFVAVGFLAGFLWSVRNGQYEDTYTPAVRMLFDQEDGNKKEEKSEPSSAQQEISAIPSQPKPHHP